MNILKKILLCFYKAFVSTINHDGSEYAGYLAFLAILSLFPILILFTSAVSIITNVINSTIILKDFAVTFIADNFPLFIIDALYPRMQEILSGPPQSLVGIALVGALWTSSSAVEGLRAVVNRAYRVSPPAYVFRRMLSILQFMMIIVMMVFASISLFITPIIIDKLVIYVNFNVSGIVTYVQYIVGNCIIISGISWIYVVLPNIKNKIISVLPGSVLVWFLWNITVIFLKIYIKNFKQLNIVYGSLEGFVVALLFFYLINLCLIYGAEFNYYFALYWKKK